MQESKSTKLTIRDDRPTGISTISRDAHVDAMGFNILYIALRKPLLAIQIMKLYEEAHVLKENDPKAHDEDYDMAQDMLSKLRDSSV